MEVMPIHQRLAELWMVNKRRPLTDAEMMEVHHCLSANVDYVWKMCYLQNLSLMASMTDDIEWQFEICAQIEELQYGQIKKSGRKRSTDEK